ncbi:MAG TPA: hypothetical protein VFR44_05075, partial [Actinomycetota bacterium]|nr:hypothetical protein [Actinomycetota bacterium]
EVLDRGGRIHRRIFVVSMSTGNAAVLVPRFDRPTSRLTRVAYPWGPGARDHLRERVADVRGSVLDDDGHMAAEGAEAALAATQETAEAIERAAERNDDPSVAEALEEAATHADTAATRVGWLRGVIRRVFGRS